MSSLIPVNSTNPWRSFMGEIYYSRKAPYPLGTVKFEEIEAKAREKLKDIPGQPPVARILGQSSRLMKTGAFDYAGGSCGINSTDRVNKQAFSKWGIIPRMLRNATDRTLEVSITIDKLLPKPRQRSSLTHRPPCSERSTLHLSS